MVAKLTSRDGKTFPLRQQSAGRTSELRRLLTAPALRRSLFFLNLNLRRPGEGGLGDALQGVAVQSILTEGAHVFDYGF